MSNDGLGSVLSKRLVAERAQPFQANHAGLLIYVLFDV
jgi:hypothetical protein